MNGKRVRACPRDPLGSVVRTPVFAILVHLFVLLGFFGPMASAAPKPKVETPKPKPVVSQPKPAAPKSNPEASPPVPKAPPPKLESSAASFEIAPAASWVRPVALENASTSEAGSGGIYYVLLDEQRKINPFAEYNHEARLITSEKGVQYGASISVSFDPSYQRLVFHTIRIVRQGVEIDRLDRSQIKLLQREEELESFLYDGSFTAHCQLEDVRVGDIVEYSFTIEGANPVLRGKYFDSFPTEWSVPVGHALLRFVYPEVRSLHFGFRNKTLAPAISTVDGTREWVWESRDISPRHTDAGMPLGYNPYGMLQVTEFADWRQVVDWALPLYDSAAPLSPEIEEQVARLRAIDNVDGRILAALRFVQDEIRYLGIESGVGSHQPTAPSEVLRRRFGDCKDKTLLLSTLLRAVGLKAAPALVSSNLRRYVAERLPSPGVFNHVILRVESETATYWLDATRSHQRGGLRQIYTTDFGQALVIDPGITELTAFSPSPDAMPRRKIVENYKVRAPGKDSELVVVSEFRGLSAEGMRAYFQDTPRDSIKKDYQQYYARRFPKIKALKEVEFEELPGDAGCQVKEYYTIPDLWVLNEEKARYEITLYPNDLEQDMGTPGSSERTDPLALKHPVNITQEVHMEMFQAWPLDPVNKEISNAFFRFTEESKSLGRELRMVYSYQTLASQVPPGDVPAYDTALRRLKDQLGYTFRYQSPAQKTSAPADMRRPGAGQFNWPVALLLGGVVTAAGTLATRYFFISKLPSSLPPSLHYRSLEGLGGWLFLVAFGLIARPLVYIHANMTVFPPVFNMESWYNLTQAGQPGYHPMWMSVLLYEMLFNSLAAVFSILLIFLFFHKRAVWPRCFIIFLAAAVIGLVGDAILGRQIPAAAEGVAETLKGVGQLVMGAMVWIPYCLVSKRVQATFRY